MWQMETNLKKLRFWLLLFNVLRYINLNLDYNLPSAATQLCRHFDCDHTPFMGVQVSSNEETPLTICNSASI